MHVSFILYGERGCVNRLLNDMESQKHLLPMVKGKKKKGAYIPGQIRHLPFGVMEYVFPKESLDMVLRTMNAAGDTQGYGVKWQKLIFPTLRMWLKLKKIPKYEDKGEVYMWNKMFVNILVLGIREDAEIVGSYVDDMGWTHEAL